MVAGSAVIWKVSRVLLLDVTSVLPANVATADPVPTLMLFAYCMVAVRVGPGAVTVAVHGSIAEPV